MHDIQTVYDAAIDADAAFSANLIRLFGAKARDRRHSYDRSGWDADLFAAFERKLAADAALRDTV